MPFWAFPCACWNPYFCSVWWLWMGTKKRTIFQKQIVATKTRGFLPSEHKSCLPIFQKCHFRKKTSCFFTTTQKHYFAGFFGNCRFPCFSYLEKAKTKSAHFFFENPFLTPWQTANKEIFAPLHTICVFKITKNTINWGKTSKKQILDQVLTQPWTKLWLKKQILDQVTNIYIYTYIYIDRVWTYK